MNCNTTHYRANSSSVPGDPTRIRLLTTSGQVQTVAGSGSIAPPGLIVKPGYQDGPALQAKFAGPEGLAIGPDGALYIADSYNYCIRKLSNGLVTTVVGKCGFGGATDGLAGSALLNHPKALAFDSAGNMYIADDGVGLRKFATDGSLSTIHFRSYPTTSAIGVAVIDKPETLVVVTALDGIIAYHPSTGRDESFFTHTADLPSSVPNQVVAINGRQFLFDDALAHNIRYLRLPAPPFVAKAFIRPLAGGEAERTIENAGYVNGSWRDARFYDPMGLAIAGNRVVVADAGNRRIRQFTLPDVRVSAPDAEERYDDAHYEVAFVGGPWSFADSIGSDSICAHIETTLDRSRRFSKPVRCHTIAIDSGHETDFDGYIKGALSGRHVDLVIIGAGWWQYAVPDSAALRARMQGLLDVLTPLKARLALVWIYKPRDVSFADADWVTTGSSEGSSPVRPQRSRELSLKLENELRGLPVLQFDMYEDMVDYELSGSALPLFQPPNGELPNRRGNAFLGDHFAQGLLDAGLGKN